MIPFCLTSRSPLRRLKYVLDRAGDGWKISDIRHGSPLKKTLQGIGRIPEALKDFFMSMLRPLRDLVLGPDQQFLPSSRTGPSGAWKLLSDQWKSDSSGQLRIVRLLICCAIFLLPT